MNPDEFHYYLFIISLERCDEGCNTAEDSFGRIYVLIKIEDISCECRCEFDHRKCNSKQKSYNDKWKCENKKPIKYHVFLES